MGAFHFNVFHILGDVSHTTSKLVLIWAIHSNSSAEGVSLITQVLYALVFLTRYLDIFTSRPGGDWTRVWNFTLKIFYMLSSLYIIFLMTRVYARTRERQKAWRFGVWCVAGAVVLAPVWFGVFHRVILGGNWFMKLTWTFSEILESVCILPQLLLLRQTTVPTVLDSFYLATLGTYRFCYVLNWIVRGASHDYVVPDPTSWVFGSIQTVLMLDFAWVYLTRQRVKLRHGGVVDSEDLEQGWLVRWLVGGRGAEGDGEEGVDREAHAQNGDRRTNGTAAGSKWGRRGISVSADEGVLEREHARKKKATQDPESQPLADPDAFENESDEWHAQEVGVAGVSGGDEWRDDEEAR